MVASEPSPNCVCVEKPNGVVSAESTAVWVVTPMSVSTVKSIAVVAGLGTRVRLPPSYLVMFRYDGRVEIGGRGRGFVG